MICAVCGAPSTLRFSRGTRMLDVCARCLDRLELQDAFEARLLELDQLAIDGRHAAALALLGEVLSAHGARDHDGWLARSVLAHRAILLDQQGDLAAALQARLALLEGGIPDPSEEMAERLALATLLERMGRLEEAAEAAEQALVAARGPAAAGVVPVLARYAHICEQLGRHVPPRHRPLLVEAIRRWGLPIEASLLADPAPLAPAIAAAEQELRTAQARFQALQLDLQQRPREQRAAVVDAYLAQEPVALFRQMAEGLRDRQQSGRPP